jgi:hypothetical protein
MTLLHFRYQSRLGLLAASVLEAHEAQWVLKHTESCGSCRTQLLELKRTVETLAADAALDRPLPIPSAALRTRVLARVHAEAARPAHRPAWTLTSLMAAVSLAGIGLAVIQTRMSSPAPDPVTASTVEWSDTAANDNAFYERLAKTHTRANAAKYLSDAQDILIQVAAAADCPESPQDRVDVTREAQISRTLLTRRAALVSGSEDSLVAARGVMEEVEGFLQQVAELPQCTRRSDVNAIAERVDRRHLLMKIDMVTQELAAP